MILLKDKITLPKHVSKLIISYNNIFKDEVIPVQAWTGP